MGDLWSWDAALAEFLAEKRRTGRYGAVKTVSTYRAILDGKRTRAWREREGITGPADLTAKALARLEACMADDGCRPLTIRDYHRTVLNFAAWSRREGLGTPEITLRAPACPIEEPQTYTDAQVAQIVAACPTPRDRFIVEFLLGTGLRVSEACAVTLDDLVNDARMGNFLRVRRGKGSRDRIVPLDPMLTKRIRLYVRDTRPRETDRRELLLSHRSYGLEFAPLKAEAIQRMLLRLQVPGVRVHAHGFRHTFASRAIAAGKDPLTLQAVLGHTTMAMTARYVHFSPATLIQSWSREAR